MRRAWLVRRGAVRTLILALLLIAELLRPFGGTTVMAHGHEGEGIHLHLATTPDVVDRLAAWRDSRSCWGCQSEEQFAPFCSHSAQTSCSHDSDKGSTGFLVSIPDFDDAMIRGSQAQSAPRATTVPPLPLPLFGLPTPALTRQGSPGSDPTGRSNHRSLRACARIVRTSHALLI